MSDQVGHLTPPSLEIELEQLKDYGDFRHFHTKGTPKTFHPMPHQLVDAYSMYSAEKTPLFAGYSLAFNMASSAMLSAAATIRASLASSAASPQSPHSKSCIKMNSGIFVYLGGGLSSSVIDEKFGDGVDIYPGAFSDTDSPEPPPGAQAVESTGTKICRSICL